MAEAYSAALAELTRSLPPPWQFIDWSQGVLSWRLFRLAEATLPRQGWKIHISAAAIEGPGLCALVLPALLRLSAAFKIARRFEDIVLLNSGDAGWLPLGKIVTVYPQSDRHAAEVAEQIDRLWPASRGPEVQTDLHVRPGSAVSLRYGVFGSEGPIVISETGQYEFALTLPDGSRVADTRRRIVEQAGHTPNPPIAGYPPRRPPLRLNETLIANSVKYIPIALLRESPKLTIFLGLNLESLENVILKLGRPGIAGDHRGMDSRDRLRKEFEILSALTEEADLAPKPVQRLAGEWPVSIIEDFRGALLSELPRAQQIDCLVPLARALDRIHRAGFVHGDIKLENAVVRGVQVGLIDFELAEREGCTMSPGGTRGYLAPEVAVDTKAAFARDVYALAGCIVHAVLGIPPGLLPGGMGRLAGLLRLEGATAAARLVQTLAAPEPGARPTAAAAVAMIERQLSELRAAAPAPGYPSTAAELNWCRRAGVEAVSLVERYAQTTSSGTSGWRNEHFMSAFLCEGINIGAAGIILGLASIDHALGRDDASAAINAGAKWLAQRGPEGNAAGLFTGNAGVAVALAVAGQRLASADYILAAQRRLQYAVSTAREVDLFSGSAGVMLAGRIIGDILGTEWPLECAELARSKLERSFHPTGDIPLWRVDPESDTPYLGCAHGSSGIALALAHWGQRTGDREALAIALETFHKIVGRGRTEDGGALRMALDSTQFHAPGNWCHGTAGYLWAVLQAFGDHPDLRTEIDWAVASVQSTMVAGTPTYCHGLAGRLELWRLLGEVPRFRELAATQAGKTARALRVLHRKVGGRIAWMSDDPQVMTPDLWVGFLGPASALALHAAHASAPLLSGRWLAQCASGLGLVKRAPEKPVAHLAAGIARNDAQPI